MLSTHSLMEKYPQPDAMQEWLHSHGFDEYVSTFMQHRMEPGMLDKLSWQQLDKLIPRVGDQIRFDEAVARRNETAPTSTVPTPTPTSVSSTSANPKYGDAQILWKRVTADHKENGPTNPNGTNPNGTDPNGTDPPK